VLKIVESAEVSKETHSDLFRGIEAIAKEFPNGWSVAITTGDTVFLEIKPTAPAGNSRRTPLKKETALGVQKALGKLREEALEIQRAFRSVTSSQQNAEKVSRK
jgi:hypothetical protein